MRGQNSFEAFAPAYAAARDLADGLVALGQGLTLPDAIAGEVIDVADLVRSVLAPRITSAERIAEIAITIGVLLRRVGHMAEPTTAAGAFYALATHASGVVPPASSPGLRRQTELARCLAAAVEAAALGEAFRIEAVTVHSDRSGAAGARARISAAMEASADRIAAAGSSEVYGLVSEVARLCSEHLVRVANDLRPIVQVQTTRSLPATALAWTLYGDPDRADELAARNNVATPMFMPATFEALAPDEAA